MNPKQIESLRQRLARRREENPDPVYASATRMAEIWIDSTSRMAPVEAIVATSSLLAALAEQTGDPFLIASVKPVVLHVKGTVARLRARDEMKAIEAAKAAEEARKAEEAAEAGKRGY
jgi:hypothetical protein